MNPSNATPTLRFKGFEGKWEERKLGEVADIVGGGTPSTSIPEFWNGKIDWYAPAEIGDQVYLSTSQQKITEDGYLNSSAKILPIGTVLFTSRAGIGKSAILKKEGCTNQGFQSIVPHPDLLDSYFIYSRTAELKKYGEAVGAGSTFLEVSGKQMADMDLLIPSTMAEQQKIGLYFSYLDRLLFLQAKKLEKLQSFKKAMLEKMFPQKGSKVPEIRFRGFAESWEERILGEIASKVTEKNVGLQYLETFTNSAEYGIISQSDFFDNAISKISSLDGYYIVRPQDFVYNPRISATAPVGPINCNKLGRTGVMSPLYTVFRIENIDATYLEYFFKSSVWHPFMYYNGDSGARSDRFSIKDQIFFEMPILLPSVNEQRKIGQYFSQLDHLISLQALKLTKLKGLKKALLERMFPPTTRAKGCE